jgi:hypothetical protein
MRGLGEGAAAWHKLRGVARERGYDAERHVIK